MSSGNSFARQIHYFKRDFNVFAPDLKGFGNNTGMEKPYSLDDYIKEVKEYKYKHGLVSPHIIAHSFGGRIAIKACAEDGSFCDKLVLVGAAGLKPKDTLLKKGKRVAFNLLKKFVSKDKLKFFYSKDYLALDGVMRESFQKIIKEHLDDKIGAIKNPTLVIVGENDKETPVYMAKRLFNGINDSRLIIINGAGHFCFIDKPAKFNTEVREFLLS